LINWRNSSRTRTRFISAPNGFASGVQNTTESGTNQINTSPLVILLE
jgi:hypothetical protein